MRNKGGAYITKGGELQNWYADPDFCGGIYIGKEKNYQQFQSSGSSRERFSDGPEGARRLWSLIS